MLTRADLVLLAVIALIVAASVQHAWRVLRRDRQTMQKYKLYRVRDQLIYLVGAGVIKETDFIFQSLYSATNNLVRSVDRLNLKALIRALQAAREAGEDPAERAELEKIQDALRCQPKEVVDTTKDFYMAVAEIIVENSALLRALIRHSRLRRQLDRLSKWSGDHFNRPEPPTISYYRDYRRGERAVRRVAHA